MASPKQKKAIIRPVVIGERCFGDSSVKIKVKGTKKPLAKLGTVVATVALRLVPNYSAAIVTNRAQ